MMQLVLAPDPWLTVSTVCLPSQNPLPWHCSVRHAALSSSLLPKLALSPSFPPPTLRPISITYDTTPQHIVITNTYGIEHIIRQHVMLPTIKIILYSTIKEGDGTEDWMDVNILSVPTRSPYLCSPVTSTQPDCN